MNNKIAIEGSLTDVKEYLQQKGYQVDRLAPGKNLDNYAAIVITGEDSNVMGIEDTVTKAPVITVRGLTAEGVYDEIRRRT